MAKRIHSRSGEYIMAADIHCNRAIYYHGYDGSVNHGNIMGLNRKQGILRIQYRWEDILCQASVDMATDWNRIELA